MRSSPAAVVPATSAGAATSPPGPQQQQHRQQQQLLLLHQASMAATKPAPSATSTATSTTASASPPPLGSAPKSPPTTPVLLASLLQPSPPLSPPLSPPSSTSGAATTTTAAAVLLLHRLRLRIRTRVDALVAWMRTTRWRSGSPHDAFPGNVASRVWRERFEARERRLFLASVAALALSTAASLATPRLAGRVVDMVSNLGDDAAFARVMGLLAAAVVAQLALGGGANLVLDIVGEDVALRMRRDVFAALVSEPVASFDASSLSLIHI